jgi:predicted amidohydrolase
VLKQLDSKGADFLVLPELALSDDLLKLWKHKLQQRSYKAPVSDSRANPGWVLAGSGGIGPSKKGELPPNRAVLLFRDGRTVMEQDKMSPFDMIANMVVRWQLDSHLGNKDVLEGMCAGTIRRIRDLRAGRVAILVCEDHGRPIQMVSHLAEYEPGLIFVPIFSEPIRRFFWEHNGAREQVITMGASVVVANSCAVPVPPDTAKMARKNYGTCMAAWPVEKSPGYLSTETRISRFPKIPDPEVITYFDIPLS